MTDQVGAGAQVPRVRVVVPAFNAEKRISACLESLAAQTYRDFEVVVVDDGSTDGTAALVATHPWARLVQQVNRGPGAARRAGSQQCSSEFLAFVDDDDAWEPTRLERCVVAADGAPDAAFITTNALVVDADGSQVGTYYSEHSRFPEPGLQLDTIARRNFVFGSSLVRRTAYEEVGGFSDDRSLTGVEDYDLWIRLLLAGHRGQCIDELLAMYTVRQGSLSRQDPVRNERVRLLLLRRVLPRFWGLGVLGAPRDNVRIALSCVADLQLVRAWRHLSAARRSPGSTWPGIARLGARLSWHAVRHR